MTTGKTISLTRWTFVGKVMSLLFNMLSRLVITFLPRSKCLLISWLQSSSAVILEPKKIVWHCFHCFSIYFPRSDGTRCHDLSFLNVETQQWPQDWKRSVFIPIPKKGNAKECSNYWTIAFISHASKVMLKILQARLQQYMNCELPDVQAGFRQGRRTRDQIANICWIIKKAREVQKKHLFLLYLQCQRLWLCGSQQSVGNS